MGHPDIENRTPFAFEPLFATDEEGRPLFVAVVRATYAVEDGRSLRVAEVQRPIAPAGELHGAPGTSSYAIEPEIAFMKPATDVVLVGHAYAARAGATEGSVGLRVGPVEKTVRVVGDRVWVRSMGAISMTRPLPFEKIPLRYEEAFGGYDTTVGTPGRPCFETHNPVGVGFRAPDGVFEEGIRLPGVEDPATPIERYGQRAPPAAFGFVGVGFQPRASLAGTLDAAWEKERMPLLPRDFDRRFFNGASAGLVAPGYLRGDEQVTLAGASPRGAMAFRLPGVPPPRCTVGLRRRPDALVAMQLDTVVIRPDDDQVLLTWRGHAALRDGAHDLRAVRIETPGLAARAGAPSRAAVQVQ